MQVSICLAEKKYKMWYLYIYCGHTDSYGVISGQITSLILFTSIFTQSVLKRCVCVDTNIKIFF